MNKANITAIRQIIKNAALGQLHLIFLKANIFASQMYESPALIKKIPIFNQSGDGPTAPLYM